MKLGRHPPRRGDVSSHRRGYGVIALAAVALLTVSGCGANLHPGVAATVNGSAISQSQVDDLVGAACSYIEINNQATAQPTTLAVSDLRSTILGSLISSNLVGKAADDLGLTILPKTVQQLDNTVLPEGLRDSDTDLLTEFFHNAAQAQIDQATIGAHLKDPSVTDSSQVTTADTQGSVDFMTKFLKAQDVTVNPAYGSWDGGRVSSTSGSLSDSVSEVAKAADARTASGQSDVSSLPASQVCG